MTEIKLTAIKVGKRHRRTLGDIDQLAANIKEIGLLHPIVVTRDRKLICGQRRLEAYKRLGRSTIPCQVVDMPRILDGEVAENNMRKAFTITERVAIAASVAASLGKRQGRRTDLLQQNFAEVDDPSKRQTRHIAAQKAGLGSGETLRKAQVVIEAADKDPDQYGDLREKMDNSGKVQGAFRELEIRRDRERVARVKLVARGGRYPTLVVDPPWHYEYGTASRGTTSYATMAFPELQALPIADYAEDDCHLWLWTTNGHLANAVHLIEHWGFTYKSILTWKKPRLGMGQYLRNVTEHCLFAIQGSIGIEDRGIPSHFEAPVGEHSAKPDAFYEIVRRASLAPYGEMFQRTKRPGFKNLYGPASRDSRRKKPAADLLPRDE